RRSASRHRHLAGRSQRSVLDLQTEKRMNKHSSTQLRSVLLIAGALLAMSAHAQTARTGNDSARAMQQIQQLSAERLQLQADNAKLKAQTQTLQQQLDRANKARAALELKSKQLQAVAGRAQNSTPQSNEQLEHTRAQLQELVGKFRETAQTLRDTENERNEL